MAKTVSASARRTSAAKSPKARGEKRAKRGSRPKSGFRPCDVANAARLVALYGDSMRYCHPWKRWVVWDGKRWAEDQTGAALRLATRVAKVLMEEAMTTGLQPPRSPAEIANYRRIKAMLTLAAPQLAILPKDLDREPWLLNCDNGTLDLRTGELREHRRENFITKLCPAPFTPDAPCDRWQQFLASVFVKPPLVEYMNRFLGYCLTGEVSEQFLPIFWGEGSNGKSTLLEAFMHVLGPDYAMKAPADFLIVKANDAHPTERADLFGKRFVACVESGHGRGLNETLVKELTGGDSIRARRMYENFWEFRPTHKAVLCTNHRPEVHGIEHAIWRRLVLVPFPVTFRDADKGETGPEEHMQDKALPERLRHEAAGILAWCVQGCRDWQRERLKLPGEVVDATHSYRYDQDSVAAFIEECCTVKDGVRARAGDLHTAYLFWCAEAGRRDIGRKLFGEAVGRRFERFKNSGNWYKGVELINKSTTLEWPKFDE